MSAELANTAVLEDALSTKGSGAVDQGPRVAMLAFEWFRQREPGDIRHRNDQSLILSCGKIYHLSPGDIHCVEEASASDDVGS